MIIAAAARGASRGGGASTVRCSESAPDPFIVSTRSVLVFASGRPQRRLAAASVCTRPAVAVLADGTRHSVDWNTLPSLSSEPPRTPIVMLIGSIALGRDALLSSYLFRNLS